MSKIKMLAPILLGVLVLTVGCSSNPNKVMETARENMNDIDNYNLVAHTKMTTNMEGQIPVTVDNTYETKGSLRPEVLLSITTKTTLAAAETNEKEENVNYVEQDKEGVCYYEKQGDKWYKLSVDGLDMLGNMVKEPRKVLKSFMKYIETYKMVGETTVDGKACYEVEGTVSEDKFMDVINEINGIQDLGLNEEAVNLMNAKQSEFGGMVIRFFIDKESKTVVQQSIDLSKMMKVGLQEALKSQDSESIVDSVACNMEILYKDINHTEAVKIPEEVHSAKEVE